MIKCYQRYQKMLFSRIIFYKRHFFRLSPEKADDKRRRLFVSYCRGYCIFFQAAGGNAPHRIASLASEL